MEKPSPYRLAFLNLCSDFPSTGGVSGASDDPTFLDILLRPVFVVVVILLAATVFATAVADSDVMHQSPHVYKAAVRQAHLRMVRCPETGTQRHRSMTQGATVMEACRLGSVVHRSVQKRPEWRTIVRRFT
jgi:hypothetical protein